MKKLVRHGLLAAFMLSLSLSMAQAQPIISSQEVVMGPFESGVSAAPLPQLNMAPNSHLEITLLNPTPNPMTFSVPDLNMNVVVPPNTQQAVYIDPSMTASLTPGQQVAYYITDASGNRLASSTLVNEQTIASMITTETQQFSQVTTTEMQEPVPQRRATVRGFW